MTLSLTDALQYVFTDEGGYVNHPKDPGGATNLGITQRTLDAFSASQGHSRQDVRHLTRERAAEIYRVQYAKPIRFDELARISGGLAYALLDFAVHSGPARAVGELQKLINVPVDGVLGARTLDALQNWPDMPDLLRRLAEARLGFLKRLSTWRTFGRAWSVRLQRVGSRVEALQFPNTGPVKDYAGPIGAPSGKGTGRFSLLGALQDSRRALAAAVAFVGAVAAAIPEAMNLLQPAAKLVEGWPLLGNVLTIAAAVYVVLVKQKGSV